MDIRAAAGAVLTDWGADVIKIEHPETGDPQRELVSSAVVSGADGVNHFVEQPDAPLGQLGFRDEEIIEVKIKPVVL